MPIPVTLIAGSLGSGKTTLLQRILHVSDYKIAVIVNEFGEIGIDNRVIAGENIAVKELEGGCVCCSLTAEFAAAVTEIVEKFAPQLILVETTGVAEPDAIIIDVDDLPQVYIDGVIVVVDAYALIKFPQLGYVTRIQLETADVMLINKTDLVSLQQLQQVDEQLQKLVPNIVKLHCIRGNVDVQLLLGLDAVNSSSGAACTHQHSEQFTSFSFAAGILCQQKFIEVIKNLPPTIYRAKGFVKFAANSYLFNYVGDRWQLQPFSAKNTQLVFIGQAIDQREQVLGQLRRCQQERKL